MYVDIKVDNMSDFNINLYSQIVLGAYIFYSTQILLIGQIQTLWFIFPLSIWLLTRIILTKSNIISLLESQTLSKTWPG
jgi:hypothetical protein